MTVIALALLLPFLTGTFGVVSALAFVRFRQYRRDRRRMWYRRFLSEGLSSATVRTVIESVERAPLDFLEEYVHYCDGVNPAASQLRKIEHALVELRTDVTCIRRLAHRRADQRSRAALFLGYIRGERAIRALLNALMHEPEAHVRLRIVYALVRTRFGGAIPTIVDTLATMPSEYERRTRALLLEYGEDLLAFIQHVKDRHQPQIQRLIIDIAARYPTEELRVSLERLLTEGDAELAREAFRVLATHYGAQMDLEAYTRSPEPYFRNLAVEALGHLPSPQTMETVVPLLGDPLTRKSAVLSLSEMARRNPVLYQKLVSILRSESSSEIRQGLAEALAPRAEYLLQGALHEEWSDAPDILGMILKTGKATGVLTYLNKKADRWTRHRIAELIGTTVRTDPWLREEYAIHATDEVLEALRMEREEPDRERGTRSGENVKASTLAVTVGAALFGPAALYVIASLAYTDFRPSLGGYVQVFSAAFGVYAFLLNCVYLALLVFAGVAIARQERRWSAKPKSFLFARGVLPSVSIIAPAFNEERTIVESVTALLSLRYPDYEVIVVNDGSLDETLSQLVDHFELVRADVFVHGYLRTQPVRGIYRNPRIPGLMVIDKSNGGKADSLNAGINAARKEYFAAIDSDSVLEPDSLLKLTAGFLDTDRPVVAAGGNILPANGCILDHGHLEQVRLPGRVLPRFQMIEYVRAFMTGRSGWAQLDALLIISGAFGVFRAAEVVDSRGYLTSSERYTKDTVAEDMELVVRVTRDLRRSGLPHAVQYAPAANCWTEVPESFRVLGAQRDRWQRGLIDVLFFHLAMLFNPRYGKAAFIALPYYYVFELFGPWIEFQGYILLIAGIASGTLPATLAAFVLVAAVPLSMLTSLASVLLVEWHTSIFKGGDRINLLILSVFENLGYRQYSNILRLRGFISALRRRTGWGLMKRRGFAAREGS